MNAEQALREIGKICERVGKDDHCEEKVTYRMGDIVKACNGFDTLYYMIAISSDELKINLVGVSRPGKYKSGGYWHKGIKLGIKAYDKLNITESELRQLALPGWSLYPSTLKEAAENA